MSSFNLILEDISIYILQTFKRLTHRESLWVSLTQCKFHLDSWEILHFTKPVIWNAVCSLVKTQKRTSGSLNGSLRLNEALTEIRKILPSSMAKMRFNMFDGVYQWLSKLGSSYDNKVLWVEMTRERFLQRRKLSTNNKESYTAWA